MKDTGFRENRVLERVGEGVVVIGSIYGSASAVWEFLVNGVIFVWGFLVLALYFHTANNTK